MDQLIALFGLNTEQGLWYVTRSAGLIAYLLLWLSTVWGLAVASKIFDPLLFRAFTFDVHEFLSLIAILFTLVHIGVLVIDAYLPFSLIDLLVPFVAPYRPVWVGMGVIGLYLTVLVTVTFYLKTRIGQARFRTIHLLSFAAYAAVTVHSLFSGTESKLAATQLTYAGSALAVVLLSIYWLMRARQKKPIARPTGAAKPGGAS